MMQFAVQTPADVELKNGKARWVMAVDAVEGRFLVLNEERKFNWVPIAECKFIKLIDPEAPHPVVNVMPKGGSGLVRGNAGQIPPRQN